MQDKNLEEYYVAIRKENQDAANKAFKAIAESQPITSTFREKPTAKDFQRYKLLKAFIVSIALGRFSPATMSIVGPPGMGKTTALNALLQDLEMFGKRFYPMEWNTAIEDLDMHALAMPGVAPWDAEKKVLKVVRAMQYKAHPEPNYMGVFVLDDWNRTPESLLQVLMQLIDKHELLGEPIDNLAAMIMMSNPSGGTEDVVDMDFAQADRSYTVRVGRDDSPWEYGLAAAFPEIDLSDVFRIVKALPGPSRDVLNARALEHMLEVLLYGLPGVLALPASGPDGFMVRQKLRDNGEDITDTVVSDIARSIGAPNPEPKTVHDLYGKALSFAVEKGRNILIWGDPGVGKTEATIHRVGAMGFRSHKDCEPDQLPTVFANSAPTLSREVMALPGLTDDRNSITHVSAGVFAQPEEYVWVLDEATRAFPETKGLFKTMMSDRRIGGSPLAMRACIALANPPVTSNGERMATGDPMDLAEATRFALSLYVTDEDIDWRYWNRQKFGEEVASRVIEWREDDLDEATTPTVTPRCLTRMLNMHLMLEDGVDMLEWALPMKPGTGEQVPAPISLLKIRLEQGELPRLRRIAEEVDRYEAELPLGQWVQDEKGQNLFIPDDPQMHERVAEAFRMADLDQLEANRPVLVRLFPLLGLDFHKRFIQDGDLQQFWVKVLLEGSKSKVGGK